MGDVVMPSQQRAANKLSYDIVECRPDIRPCKRLYTYSEAMRSTGGA